MFSVYFFIKPQPFLLDACKEATLEIKAEETKYRPMYM
jgi:hypothetical protein